MIGGGPLSSQWPISDVQFGFFFPPPLRAVCGRSFPAEERRGWSVAPAYGRTPARACLLWMPAGLTCDHRLNAYGFRLFVVATRGDVACRGRHSINSSLFKLRAEVVNMMSRYEKKEKTPSSAQHVVTCRLRQAIDLQNTIAVDAGNNRPNVLPPRNAANNRVSVGRSMSDCPPRWHLERPAEPEEKRLMQMCGHGRAPPF